MQPVKSHHPPGGFAVITGEQLRHVQAMRCVSMTQVPNGTARIWEAGALIAYNINQALKTAMARPELEWVWLMGDDHTYEPTLLLDLLDRDVDCVLPLCLNRSPPFAPTIISNGRLKPLDDLPTTGLYRLGEGELCGDSGLLVRRRVLEAIPEPWYDHRISGSHNAEDRAFVERIKAAGFGVHVDMDHVLGHQTTFTILPDRSSGQWEVALSTGERNARPFCNLRFEVE